METQLLPITPQSLALAKEILVGGGLVAFPTETVYGLGADAMQDGAVREIFKVKGRPQDNPLIVHVHPEYDLSLLVEEPKDYAKKMMSLALRLLFLHGTTRCLPICETPRGA